ncbi:MAG TPA: FkbM family methyltransferase [Pyrinomonadaceae bacterium]|nr:FkbM family methyltransferase [Pyrinomonadaceae bacterium]
MMGKTIETGERSSAATRLLLNAVRFYTFNTPVAKGKYRLYQTVLDLIHEKPRALPTKIKDGRKMVVDLTTGMQESVYFVGEYETFITAIAREMIREGDVCIDVGANFGWYTTLMSLLSGRTGEVHAFEPVPQTFRELERNRALAPNQDRIFVNNFALGDQEAIAQINVFKDLPSGHASLSSKGGSGASSFECRVTTLDAYLTDRSSPDINFVKVDIEGAEMMFLRGAEGLFEQKVPPVILMEMALAQTRNFGYTPNDLIEFIAARADYAFYKVDEPGEVLIRIDGFDRDDIGANVFCVPATAPAYITRAVERFLKN